jgi:type I restriction enzyme S subunit
MEYAIGIVAATAVGLFGTVIGFDKERSFYPVVLIVIAALYLLFALADQLEERLTTARGQVEQLTPSLLARAFAGQLVPQDPTDESAETLLERTKQFRRK